ARGRGPRLAARLPPGGRCGSGRTCRRRRRASRARPRAGDRSRALPGLRLPFELGAADADHVAGDDPGAAQLGLDTQPGQVALEALRRFLDIEVGLRRDPLDAGATHPERAVAVELDREAVAHRLDAVDDDTRRLGWLGELDRAGEQVGDARPEVPEPVSVR